MSWLLGGGVVALLAAFAVLNPLAAARLASSVSGFVLDKLRGLIQWARAATPEQWWRAGCFAAGTAFLVASFVAWDARQTIVIVRQECAAKLEAERSVSAGLSGIAENNRQAVQTCKATLTAEVGKRQEVERLGQAAVASAQQSEAQAERELTEWKRRYIERPKGCEAALQEVQAQCPTLSDY